MSFNKLGHNGAVANSTRAVSAGGYSPSAYFNAIEFVTIMTTGDSNDFGDLIVPKYAMGSFSSPTRGLFCGGDPGTSPNTTDDVDFIEIATLGNAQDFGDLIVAARHAGGTSSCTRAVCTSGPGFEGSISYVQIATKGNAVDYGDMSETRRGLAGCSNAHGGLG